MQRHSLRGLFIVLFPLAPVSLGCTEEPIDLSDESGSLDEDTEETETGGEPSEESDGGPATDSEAPTVHITLDGATVPPPLESAAELHLQAEADDASDVSVVEFYIDDQLISSDDEAPYEANLTISNTSFNGVRRFSARAVDLTGNAAEDALLLPVVLPEPGTVEWEYLGPDDGERWLHVSIGAHDSALVVGEHSLLRISDAGELLMDYEFTYPVSAATATDDGGVIALGTIGDSLVVQRFNSEGTSVFLDFLEEFVGPNTEVIDATIGDNDRLIISSVNSYDGEVTGRISSIAYQIVVDLEWHHYLTRDGQPTNNMPIRVAVAPNGEIYATAAFEHSIQQTYFQLRRIGQAAYPWWTFEDLSASRSTYSDIVATEGGIFVAGRQDDQAAIARFDDEGDPITLYYVDGGHALVIERLGDDLLYGSKLDAPSEGMVIGRISTDGLTSWSTQLGTSETALDMAVTDIGHVYVLSEFGDSARPRLQRLHP
jgi:hypothetical protein